MHHRVLQAMARPAMNHRGPEFKEILSDVRSLTQYVFGTRREVAVLSGSGTAGLEAAVTGLVRKGDRVLNLVNGKFSERFHELCQVFSTPTALTFEWGTAVRPERVAEALDADEYRAVTLCWNETSTGLTNPIADIAKVVKAHDALLIVDGITAVGGLENHMEAWGIDAVIVGSQKCIAAPAGLSAVALCAGLYFIKHKNVHAHRVSMLVAFGFSSLFLVSYIVNHALRGDTSFPGIGTARRAYLSILSSHILLSIIALPLV